MIDIGKDIAEMTLIKNIDWFLGKVFSFKFILWEGFFSYLVAT